MSDQALPDLEERIKIFDQTLYKPDQLPDLKLDLEDSQILHNIYAIKGFKYLLNQDFEPTFKFIWCQDLLQLMYKQLLDSSSQEVKNDVCIILSMMAGKKVDVLEFLYKQGFQSNAISLLNTKDTNFVTCLLSLFANIAIEYGVTMSKDKHYALISKFMLLHQIHEKSQDVQANLVWALSVYIKPKLQDSNIISYSLKFFLDVLKGLSEEAPVKQGYTTDLFLSIFYTVESLKECSSEADVVVLDEMLPFLIQYLYTPPMTQQRVCARIIVDIMGLVKHVVVYILEKTDVVSKIFDTFLEVQNGYEVAAELIYGFSKSKNKDAYKALFKGERLRQLARFVKEDQDTSMGMVRAQVIQLYAYAMQYGDMEEIQLLYKEGCIHDVIKYMDSGRLDAENEAQKILRCVYTIFYMTKEKQNEISKEVWGNKDMITSALEKSKGFSKNSDPKIVEQQVKLRELLAQ